MLVIVNKGFIVCHCVCLSPSPTTLVGLVGYYRCFCRNFSTVVAPLTDLLKGKAKYVWSPECQKAFESVKALICNALHNGIKH